MIKNEYWYSCEVTIILVRFLGTVSKNIPISNFTKILQIGRQLYFAYGQADKMKLDV